MICCAIGICADLSNRSGQSLLSEEVQRVSNCTMQASRHPGKTMIRRFTDNAVELNPITTENAMECTGKKLFWCSIRATCCQPVSHQNQLKSSMISEVNAQEAEDLRFRSMADAAPMRILYSSSSNPSRSWSSMAC